MIIIRGKEEEGKRKKIKRYDTREMGQMKTKTRETVFTECDF